MKAHFLSFLLTLPQCSANLLSVGNTTNKGYTMKRSYEDLAAGNENTQSTPEALAQAEALLQDKARIEAVARAAGRLNVAQTNVNTSVALLREARKSEAKAKTYLNAVGAAFDNFRATGDWDAYSKAITEASHAFRS
jgi:hypothetical protein